MFSRGTFLRYLYEVDLTHKEVAEIYHRLASQTQDPVAHERIAKLAEEVDQETDLVSQIRQALTAGG